MKKRRINFFYCATNTEMSIRDVVLVETALAINGIKAAGYVEANKLNRPFDWEMQQNGAEESLVKACDMVVFDDCEMDESKQRVLFEAKRWNIPAFAFHGEATTEISDFKSCICTCKSLLGRESDCEPILIQ